MGFICCLSKFVVCEAFVESPTSSDCIRMIEEKVMPLGVPRLIYSDRGSIFASSETQDYCAAAHIESRLGTSYHHKLGASIERWWTILEQLVRLCGVQDKWDEALPQLVSAYHDTSCRALDGATPFEVVYGFRRRDGVEVAW